MTYPTEFIPQIVDEDPKGALVTFLLRLNRCPYCGRLMKPSDKSFPEMRWLNHEKQTAQFPAPGRVAADLSGVICADCVKAGRETFVCQRCGQTKQTDQLLTDDVADDWWRTGEFLCLDCFETMTAKEWVALLKAVDERHSRDSYE